jgi:hypothetical protein
MSIISFKHRGDFSKTEKLLTKSFGKDYMNILERYGKLGVEMLSANTPVDTGLTAASWSYKIEQNKGNISVIWYNSNINRYVNIAIILQYGHATRNGGWVQGRDYINPALQPIFDAMADAAWKEVTSI